MAEQLRARELAEAFGGGVDVEELIGVRVEKEQRVPRLVEQRPGQLLDRVGVHGASLPQPLPVSSEFGGGLERIKDEG